MAKRAPLKKAMAAHEHAVFQALEAENAVVAWSLDQIRKHPGPLRGLRAAAPHFAGAAAAATCLIRRSSATWAAMQVLNLKYTLKLMFPFHKSK